MKLPSFPLGTPVYENPLATTSAQARTHRKKRINKKWGKKYGTKQVPGAYLVGNKLICHPEIAAKMRQVF